MKKIILLGLTSSFLFAGGMSVSIKPVDNTIYEKETWRYKRTFNYSKRG